MKNLNKVLLTVLFAVLLFPLLLCRANASKASKAKKAYKKYVSAHTLSDPYMYGMKNPDYKIVDVNGDKIPELLFVNRKDFYVEVWTFRGGKMRCMFKEIIGKSASFAYKKSKHQVAVIHMHTSGCSMQIYKAKKTKLKETKKLLTYGDACKIGYTNNESMRGTTVYLINKKKVKKKAFKKSWNKYKFTDSYWKIK